MPDREEAGTLYLTPSDMHQWVQQEIRDAAKALQLRISDLTELATAYAAGEITPQRADELHSRYYDRWGESLPGVTVGPTVTDEQIVAALDAAAARSSGLTGNAALHTERLRTPGRSGREQG